MVVSAAVYGIAGLAFLFLPQEIADLAGWGVESSLPVQFASAGLMAMSYLNWNGRTAVFGGIYGRPIVLANIMFSVIGATTLRSGISSSTTGVTFAIGTALMVIFVVVFGRFLWSSPWD